MHWHICTLGLAAVVACRAPSTEDRDDTGVEVEPGEAVVVVSGPRILALGTEVRLEATLVRGAREDRTAELEAVWATSDPVVLPVQADGTVRASRPGQATVTATYTLEDGPVTGSHLLEVRNDVPYYDAWLASGHADHGAGAFTHWDEDGEIPPACARCHATPGFRDFLGADGSAAGTVDAPAPLGTAVECTACHAPGAGELTEVAFPSGEVVEGLGPEARCLVCHQGRASGDDLAWTTTPDVVDPTLGFTNVHAYPAGATLYAGQVRGGFEYPDRVYDYRFRHVSGFDTCVGCHDSHGLQVRVQACATCHPEVRGAEDLPSIRALASSSDYDGDGDTAEGIAGELAGLRALLLAALRQYVRDQGQAALCYAPQAYPYFFVDTDGDGACGDDEAAFANAYGPWSPRGLAAAYNLHLATQDPGAYAHNAKYVIQLLHDSLRDLDEGLTAPPDRSIVRTDPGHFDGAGPAARYWDDDEAVSPRCSRCHGGAEGLAFFLQYGVGLQDGAPDNGLECETCHIGLPSAVPLRQAGPQTLPSGVEVASTEPTTDLCTACHQGRQAGADVAARIAEGRLGFVDIHGLPAGAIRWGAQGAAGFEYADEDYAGPELSHPGGAECVHCHEPVASAHTFQVRDAFVDVCTPCHKSAADVHDIRVSHGLDYDGDGLDDEPLADELDGLEARLLAAMQDAAALCYRDRYPYFFADLDADRTCGTDETIPFAAWTPALTAAAFNYQLARKDPGAWAHNFDYVAQLLHDAIADVGGATGDLERP